MTTQPPSATAPAVPSGEPTSPEKPRSSAPGSAPGPAHVVGDPPRRVRPSAEQLATALGRTIPDVLAPGLRVVFCGINPGLWSAAIGKHFARPGNRFWPALYASGFTPHLLGPYEQEELPRYGLGLTNVVPRATARADELAQQEYRDGGRVLAAKLAEYQPHWVAVLGIGAYRTAFDRRQAQVGPQQETLSGSRVWVLPNPSGLNAHWTAATLAEEFRALRLATGLPDRGEQAAMRP